MNRMFRMMMVASICLMGQNASANAQIPSIQTISRLPELASYSPTSIPLAGNKSPASNQMTKQAYQLLNQKLGLINNAVFRKDYTVIQQQTAEMETQIDVLRSQAKTDEEVNALNAFAASIQGLSQSARQSDTVALQQQIQLVRQNKQHLLAVHTPADDAQKQQAAAE